ncbi:MAG: succinate dehydrogenase cytochrome b subunit [Myxococcota bacterium]
MSGAASILKKMLMALTGLAWFGFLVGHLSGNFLMFKGPEAFNHYAEFLESTGALLIAAELGLIAFLALHVGTAAKLVLENRSARRRGYAVSATNGQASWGSRTMAVAGTILLAFIILHVRQFKFGDHTQEFGLWGLVIRSFQDPLVVGGYVVAMLALGLHLSHGFGSAFQSLGVIRPTWRANLRILGVAFGWAIALGFISLPVYAFFFESA